MSPQDADDTEMLAAEYVLGSLDLAEMRDAEARSLRDPAFAGEMRFWEDRLFPLSGLVADMAPPAALWSRLALATGIGSDTLPATRANGTAEVIALSRRKRGWQVATLAASAIAASLAVALLLPAHPGEEAPSGRFAAAIGSLSAPARYLAESQPDGSIVVTGLAAEPAVQGHDYQLWALPEGGAKPVPLGLLTPGREVVKPSDRPMARTQLLVSDEPAGGSKTGAPTGPVVFGGMLVPFNPATTPGR